MMEPRLGMGFEMLKIGGVMHPSRAVVAPMAGVTDRPFRDLCRQFGSFWLVAEMLTSDQTLWNTSKSRLRRIHADEPSPRWVQIAGSDPQTLALAGLANERAGAQILDINMGCPAKKVCNKAAGSALLRDETLVANILGEVCRAVSIPVTLKYRLGWSKQEQNAVTVAKIAQDAGIQALSVHGRTRACRFEGLVDYDAIAQVKSAVSIPVIANGDICSPEQARSVIDRTGADAVMVGRAVQGRPWLPADIDAYLNGNTNPIERSFDEKCDAMLGHLLALHEFYGQAQGVRIARKHAGWFFAANLNAHTAARRTFNQITGAAEQIDFLTAIKRTAGNKVAA